MNELMVSIPEAIAAFKQGEMLIMTDDEDRENEGDLIIPAAYADADAINFMATYGRGLICLPMSVAMFDRLNIPMMTTRNRSPYQTAFGVSFEAVVGVSTGISAGDRAQTVAVAIDPDSRPDDILMPGHMFPLKAAPGGVLTRAGHTEGSTDLARLAGFDEAAVLCEIMNDDGSMARQSDLKVFAKTHQLKMITIEALKKWRAEHDPIDIMEKIDVPACASLPLHGLGDFTTYAVANDRGGADHLVLMSPTLDVSKPCLVRIHSECVTGDVFDSMRCDCGEQLSEAMRLIADEGGVLIYLRQEGRCIGLRNKIKAYALQDQGYDTVEANERLGFSPDAREYAQAASILQSLGIQYVTLLTNNQQKVADLQLAGLRSVARVPLVMPSNPKNRSYLRTKQEKLGHLLESDEVFHG